MIAAKAAYECMQRVTRRLGYENLTVEFVQAVEREFTEIISQVTPITPLWVAASRARLSTDGERAAVYAMRGATERARATLGSGSTLNLDELNQLLFPQEIVEPQPKPWWKRWFA